MPLKRHSDEIFLVIRLRLITSVNNLLLEQQWYLMRQCGADSAAAGDVGGGGVSGDEVGGAEPTGSRQYIMG